MTPPATKKNWFFERTETPEKTVIRYKVHAMWFLIKRLYALLGVLLVVFAFAGWLRSDAVVMYTVIAAAWLVGATALYGIAVRKADAQIRSEVQKGAVLTGNPKSLADPPTLTIRHAK